MFNLIDNEEELSIEASFLYAYGIVLRYFPLKKRGNKKMYSVIIIFN